MTGNRGKISKFPSQNKRHDSYEQRTLKVTDAVIEILKSTQ